MRAATKVYVCLCMVPDELEASAQESGSNDIVDEERSRVRLQNTLPSK